MPDYYLSRVIYNDFSLCERPASSSFNDVGFSYGQTGEGADSNDAGQPGQDWLHCTHFLSCLL